VACLTVKKSDAELFLEWKEVFRILMVRSRQRQEGLIREGSMEDDDEYGRKPVFSWPVAEKTIRFGQFGRIARLRKPLLGRHEHSGRWPFSLGKRFGGEGTAPSKWRKSGRRDLRYKTLAGHRQKKERGREGLGAALSMS
jgi:hypothetical protein